MIPYGRQDIDELDIKAVVDVLQSDYLTQGPAVPRFEESVMQVTHSDYALAVNSATSALHIAVDALGLGEGDLMWTSPITFVASANCGRYCGSDVDFVDIDPQTFNMCPMALEVKLKVAARARRLPKVLVVVHMGGQSSDMERISTLARAHGIAIVEDASHAIGASYMGKPVGCCAYSDITVFSFHPVKIVTTAEGGMAVTNSKELAGKMSLARSHGITRDLDEMTHESEGAWYYQMVSLGWNYRMTELQAALGVSQMTRLEDFVSARNRIADRYDALLADLPIDLPGRQPGARSSFHLYIVRLQRDIDVRRKSEIFDELRADGLGVNLHYIPVHLQPYYIDMGFAHGDFPSSEDYYQRAISIPLYPGLSDTDQETVVQSLAKALS